MATNGVSETAVKQEVDSGAGDAPERTADHSKLLENGLNVKIANKLDDIFKTGNFVFHFFVYYGSMTHCQPHSSIVSGKLTFEDLDTRAFEALKEFPTDGALAVLAQFVDSNLDHVSNKSAYLCGMMKTYRQKLKTAVPAAPPLPNPPKGPDEEKIKVHFFFL